LLQTDPGRLEKMPSQIKLAYLRDRSRLDLSIRLGIPANTVKAHLRRALLELRAAMFASIQARTHSAA
jgi:RNA polymerase sigma-70 factor (ECF subfamily)